MVTGAPTDPVQELPGENTTKPNHSQHKSFRALSWKLLPPCERALLPREAPSLAAAACAAPLQLEEEEEEEGGCEVGEELPAGFSRSRRTQWRSLAAELALSEPFSPLLQSGAKAASDPQAESNASF